MAKMVSVEIKRAVNAITVQIGRVSLTQYWRCRSGRFGWESHLSSVVPGSRWLHVWIGSPTHHRWWALNLYLVLNAR